MKKLFKTLNTKLCLENIGGQPVCTLFITRADLLDRIAILWMTIEEIGTAIVSTKSGLKCSIVLGQHSSVTREDGTLSITLNQNDLTVFGAFLLRFYRDGLAEVSHLDFEAEFNNMNGYITIKVEDFLPPVSKGEALRRLGG